MFILQPLPAAWNRTFDGARYACALTMGADLTIAPTREPAHLRLRLGASDPRQLVAYGPAVAGGCAVLNVQIGWHSYFVELDAKGGHSLTIDVLDHVERDPGGGLRVSISSAAIVDDATRAREQHVPRHGERLDGMDGPTPLTLRPCAPSEPLDPYFQSLERGWDEHGQADPMFYILTVEGKRGGRWDPNEFFATGISEIDHGLDLIDSRSMPLVRGRALDFGCGVGRLTQALARHFDEVHGVDISAAMLQSARKWNAHGSRVAYHHNDQPDLRLFADGQFDLVYTNIVLQHMRPEYARRYLEEFSRILAPGGVVLFQLPSSPYFNLDGLGLRMSRLKSRFGYGPSPVAESAAVMEFHWIRRGSVIRCLKRAGLEVADVIQDQSAPAISYRYCARKPGIGVVRQPARRAA